MDEAQREKLKRFFHHLSPDSRLDVMEVAGQLRGFAHFLNQRADDSFASAGLSSAQWRILSHILFGEVMDGQPGMNPSEISERHGTNRNTVSGLIRSLEKSGYIERELDDHDRRKFNICLTDSGRALVYDYSQRHFAALEKMFGVLSDEEVAEFGRILTKLTNANC